jgi:hypothetical protein
MRCAAVVLVASLSLGSSTLADAQMIELDKILALTLLDLKRDADPKALAAAMAGSPSGAHLLRADRGLREGQFAVAASGSGSAPDDPGKRVAGALARLTSLVASAQSFEYQLLSPDVVGPLPSVDVLGMHFHQVREDRREAFERFVHDTIHPAVGRLRPDLRVLYYRSASTSEGQYVAVFTLTRESRDKYWPGGSDSDDLRAAFAPVRGLTTELKTYLIDGSYLDDERFAASVYESREWTDFVIVPRDSR